MSTTAAKYAALESAAEENGVSLNPNAPTDFHTLPGSEHQGVLENKLTSPSKEEGKGKVKPPIDQPPAIGQNKHFVDPRKNVGLNPRNRR